MKKIQTDKNTLKRLVFLEAAYRHHDIQMRRSVGEDRVTVGEYLEFVFELEQDIVLAMGVVRNAHAPGGEGQTVITDPSEIWAFDMVGCLLSENGAGGHTMDPLAEVTLIITTTKTPFLISLVGLGGSDTLKYLRASILSPGSANVYDSQGRVDEGYDPYVFSSILSYSEIPDNPLLKKYEEVENSAQRKLGEAPLDELETEFFYGRYEFRREEYLQHAQSLFDQNRFHDAYALAKRAYNYYKRELNPFHRSSYDNYYTASNLLGDCLSKLGRDDEAAYYFYQGRPGMPMGVCYKNVLCMARLGNPKANKELEMLDSSFAENPKEASDMMETYLRGNVHMELMRYKEEKRDYFKKVRAAGNDISLLEMLNTLFGVEKQNILAGMSVFDLQNGTFCDRIADVDEICRMTLNAPAANNKAFLLSISMTNGHTHDETDKSELCVHAPIMLCTRAVKDKKGQPLLCVDVAKCNFNTDDDCQDLISENEPKLFSFTMSMAKDWRFNTSEEERVECKYFAAELSKSGQLLESFKLSKWLYETSLDNLKDETGVYFDTQDPSLWDLFFEACYRVGLSLVGLGLTSKAFYYLDVARNSGIPSHLFEFVNCLCKEQDPNALPIIDNMIKNTPKPRDKKGMDTWNQSMAFLKKSKVRVLMEKERFSEAKNLLEEMLDDPLCKDFAKEKLNHIKERARMNPYLLS